MKSVAIFCGARYGRQEAYRQAAEILVNKLVERGVTIVYGGGNVGLMGAIADRALACGGKVVGVIPHALVEQEQAHNGLSELIHVNDMHERKQKMSELADGFITLSGGAGSMDELFQEIAHKQIGYHGKPCAILNTAGYYDHLLAWLENAVNEGFITQYWYDQLVIERSPVELVDRLMEAII
ncbi:TIGR00730 family Rossman fold protein [Endozoicomonas elysicola]|uniref:Cytokinin riboside 5'-monophosphate phosphoribohydrolase n=1 Tax=Endozoicomonas elysicola TaxID=305900 RepID=A0A081K7G6_9GAMM|nr:TIGR00730 family Rossman fold protein [Endozoicomonas elysicola]KEI70092.1 DNA-binding protein [Endozoicomonas elysicola]